MVWTDPPYGVDYAAKNAFLNRSDRGNRIQTPIENDKLTAGETGHMFMHTRARPALRRARRGLLCNRAEWASAVLLLPGVHRGRFHAPRATNLGEAPFRHR